MEGPEQHRPIVSDLSKLVFGRWRQVAWSDKFGEWHLHLLETDHRLLMDSLEPGGTHAVVTEKAEDGTYRLLAMRVPPKLHRAMVTIRARRLKEPSGALVSANIAAEAEGRLPFRIGSVARAAA